MKKYKMCWTFLRANCELKNNTDMIPTPLIFFKRLGFENLGIIKFDAYLERSICVIISPV